MRRISPRTISAAFFVLTILAYGLLLPWTGFYWDDWPFAWIQKFLGPAEFLPAFAPFRPFLGPIFFGTTSLLPPNPLLWQSLALLLRFALALVAWWTFKTIWPNAKWQTLTVALLFLVFPGYSQHWVAYTHINQEIIPFLFYLLSFGFTAQALRHRDRFNRYTVFALIFFILGVFPTEYFATQEPLRFLFILILVTEYWSLQAALESLKKTIKLWLPYLLIWLANAAWLIYYYKFGVYASYGISVTEKASVLDLLLGMADAVWKAGIYSWVQVIILGIRTFSNPSTLLTLALSAVAFILTTFYLVHLDLTKGFERSWALQAIIIGLTGILLGRLPSWAAGLPLTLGSINDRFMVSMMIGGSFFAAGVIELLFNGSKYRVWCVALVIALGVGQQFYYANAFRRDWTRQQDILWQMAWRIPALEPNTVILTHELPLEFETDMGMTAPLNWIYAPGYSGGALPYALLYTRTRLERGTLPSLEPNTPITLAFRTVAFHGSTSQAVTLVVPPNACLHVLDSVYAGGDTYERYSRFLKDAIPLSNPSRILTDAPQPVMSTALFGREPAHEWCYYYEKAELARQTGNWNLVASLGNEARAQGFVPGDGLEWLPFIEGYVSTGDLQAARELSILAYNDDSRPRKGLCFTWERIQGNAKGQVGVESLSSEMLQKFQCSP